MDFSRNLYFGKRKYLLALVVLSFISLICVAFSTTDSDNFDMAKREVLLRRIGHELLLQSGDSISRVLPIRKINENEYQIRFENEFTFQTDSLVKTVQRFLVMDSFAKEYIVNVLNCDNSSVTYGYAISKNKKDDIVACIGRKQPVACYIIDIKFKKDSIIISKSDYFLGGLSFFILVGFIFLKSATPQRVVSKKERNPIVTFGSVVFDVQKRQLIINKKTIDLTVTETRVLLIFALSPNKTIERVRLQKEIWEDEGVIVGRSLDMFISKLRKKLEFDPNCNLVVVRNKGYKLEVNS